MYFEEPLQEFEILKFKTWRAPMYLLHNARENVLLNFVQQQNIMMEALTIV